MDHDHLHNSFVQLILQLHSNHLMEDLHVQYLTFYLLSLIVLHKEEIEKEIQFVLDLCMVIYKTKLHHYCMQNEYFLRSYHLNLEYKILHDYQ